MIDFQVWRAQVKKSPNPTDRHVGSRVRMRRLMCDMSQTILADALSITFQQVQKYKKGTNRISASRLQQMASALQVPVPFFFEGLPSHSSKTRGPADALSLSYVSTFLATADGLKLTKAYSQIKNRELRRSIVYLVEGIAGADD